MKFSTKLGHIAKNIEFQYKKLVSASLVIDTISNVIIELFLVHSFHSDGHGNYYSKWKTHRGFFTFHVFKQLSGIYIRCFRCS